MERPLKNNAVNFTDRIDCFRQLLLREYNLSNFLFLAWFIS